MSPYLSGGSSSSQPSSSTDRMFSSLDVSFDMSLSEKVALCASDPTAAFLHSSTLDAESFLSSDALLTNYDDYSSISSTTYPSYLLYSPDF